MRLSPAVRISIGLVALTLSLLLLGQLIGLAPDRTRAILDSRKNLSEALAVQFSAAAQRGDLPLIKETLRSIVEMENDIKSAAIRNAEGDLLTEAGNHPAHWQPSPDGRSTTTNVQIPIFNDQKRWATVEVSFSPLWKNTIAHGFKNSYLSLILFVACTGFAGYFLLIKKALRELDPSSVIPGRVRAAFDVLKEGVLILDEKEQIVLANASFAERIHKPASELIGFKGSELGWKGYKGPQNLKQLPWMQVLENGKRVIGTRLLAEGFNGTTITFVVNAGPILDGKGKSRGVLVTLDDVTELEEKNVELNQIVKKLQLITEEVKVKNLELEFLASHDPLTLLLNRRAFNRTFKEVFTEAQHNGSELSCVMCDIDHFKLVNDRHGHAAGDKVIKMVAGLLRKNSRETDLVARYGGEEFCIVLPGIDIGQAADIADRIRRSINADSSSGVQVTMSFGVSSLQFKAPVPDELGNQADKALYIAKESGRNKVVCWGDDTISAVAEDDAETISLVNKEVNSPENQDQHLVGPIERKYEDPHGRDEVQRLTIRLQELEELAEKRSQQLKYYTAYDVLTGLPTKTLFYDRISQALTRGQRHDCIVAILAVSIETEQRNDEISDCTIGDQLFKEIGTRLVKTLRSMDTIAMLPSAASPTVSYLGLEEFGILLTDLDKIDVITWIVKRILRTLGKSFVIEGQKIHVATNIGISIYPYDGDSPEILEMNATAAKKYAKKHLGINRYYFHSKRINAVSIKQLQVENKLHQAVDNDEFILHYQPKVETATGNICGVEALIRWNDPETGLVLPDEFIPVAEYSGLIHPIGLWMLSRACRQIRAWHNMGMTNCGTIAVNFSTRQFRQYDIASHIKEILEESGVDPGYLMIEVTESAIMENMKISMKVLREIRELGAGISLEDFGIGHFSLGYLKNFPLTHIKIDRSLVTDITISAKDATLAKSIISMAHCLGLKVIAEGVEDEAQANLLYDFECDEMQGVLFSKPVSENEVTTLFRDGLKYRPIRTGAGNLPGIRSEEAMM
ncbi:MAG TPA: EAL domain-containing protein [Desulfobulbus sp.]|nr:EAL domain-containing protein [Desulfobulbus sp.]